MPTLYDRVLADIEKRKDNKQKGIHNAVPYPFPKLNEYLCGIERGQAIGVLGATGLGKSKWVRYVFVYNIYRFYKETGYKVKIPFFCMEDAKEKVYKFLICHYLKTVHNTYVSIKELNSSGRELPDFVLEYIRDAKAYFEELEKIVLFIDGITEPTQIFNICEKMALSMGKIEEYELEVEGQMVKQKRYVCDTHVIAIFDNQSNIDTEDGTSAEQEAILKFVKQYMRGCLCNFYQWTCVIVLQLDFESERPSFTKDGSVMVQKVEPNLSSIGDSKRASRSLHVVFGLFNPARYDLLKYPIPPKDNPTACYDIDILGNRFRSVRIIKTNDTDVGMRIGLLFDGVGETFEELPPPGNEMAEIYSKMENKPKFTKAQILPPQPQQEIFIDDDTPF